MSIPIAPTPVLNGKNARRFDRLVKQGLKKPVKFVPTPGLEEVKNKIAKESVVDYKKAFEMLRDLAIQDKDGKIRYIDTAIKVILAKCTKGGE